MSVANEAGAVDAVDLGMGAGTKASLGEALTSWHGVPLSGLLRQAGVRVTLPRLLVMECLWESPGQVLNANALYQLLQARRQPMSLSTIYAVLQTLRQHQLVKVHLLTAGVQGFASLEG